MSSWVLVIAAHPNDDTMGCGGVMAKHFRTGGRQKVVHFTCGKLVVAGVMGR